MSVTYRYLDPEREPESDVWFRYAACFSGLNYTDISKMPKVIVYEAYVNKSIRGEAARVWLAFLHEFLDEDQFVAIESEDDDNIIEFWLDCTGLNNKQAQLYLTAFRYLHEFSLGILSLVKIWRMMDAGPEGLFIAMCNLHAKSQFQGYGTGHALMCPYSLWPPGLLTISEFQDRLLNMQHDRVHQYFAKSSQPSILGQVVDPCF